MTLVQGRIHTGAGGHAPTLKAAEDDQHHNIGGPGGTTTSAAPSAALERLKLVGGLRGRQDGTSMMDKLKQQQRQVASTSTGQSRLDGSSSTITATKPPLRSALVSYRRSNPGGIGAEQQTASRPTSRVIAEGNQAVQDVFFGQMLFRNHFRSIRPYRKTVEALDRGFEPTDALEDAQKSSYAIANASDDTPYISPRNGCDSHISIYFPTLTSRKEEHDELESKKTCYGICKGKKHPDSGPFCRFCRSRVTKRGENDKACVRAQVFQMNNECSAFLDNEYDRVLWTNAFRKADKMALKRAADTAGIKIPDLTLRPLPPKPILSSRYSPSLPDEPHVSMPVAAVASKLASDKPQPQIWHQTKSHHASAKNMQSMPKSTTSMEPGQMAQAMKSLFVSPDRALKVVKASNAESSQGTGQDNGFDEDALKDEEFDDMASIESGEIPERLEPILSQLAMTRARQRNKDEFRYETINPPVARAGRKLPHLPAIKRSNGMPLPNLSESNVAKGSPITAAFSSADVSASRLLPSQVETILPTVIGTGQLGKIGYGTTPVENPSPSLDEDINVLAIQKRIEASRLAKLERKRRRNIPLKILPADSAISAIAAPPPMGPGHTLPTVTAAPAAADAPNAIGMPYTRKFQWPALPGEAEAFIRPERVVADQLNARHNAVPSLVATPPFHKPAANVDPGTKPAARAKTLDTRSSTAVPSKSAKSAHEPTFRSPSAEMVVVKPKEMKLFLRSPSKQPFLDIPFDVNEAAVLAEHDQSSLLVSQPIAKTAPTRDQDKQPLLIAGVPGSRPAISVDKQKIIRPLPARHDQQFSDRIGGRGKMAYTESAKTSNTSPFRADFARESRPLSPDVTEKEQSETESDSSAATLQADPRSDDDSDNSDVVRVVATRPTPRTCSAAPVNSECRSSSIASSGKPPRRQQQQKHHEARKRPAPRSESDGETSELLPAADNARPKVKQRIHVPGDSQVGQPVAQHSSVQRLQQPLLTRSAISPGLNSERVRKRKRHITVTSGESEQDSEDVPLARTVVPATHATPPTAVIPVASIMEAEPVQADLPGVTFVKKKKRTGRRKAKLANYSQSWELSHPHPSTLTEHDIRSGLERGANPECMESTTATVSGDIPAGLQEFADVWVDAKLSLDDLRRYLTEAEIPSFVEELAASTKHVELDNPLKRWGFRKVLANLLHR